MARIPMVTRSIVTTKAKVMCVNINTGETEVKEVELLRTYKKDEQILKKAKTLLEDENTKVVHLVEKEEVTTIYGMLEEDFVKVANVLEDRR